MGVGGNREREAVEGERTSTGQILWKHFRKPKVTVTMVPLKISVFHYRMKITPTHKE